LRVALPLGLSYVTLQKLAYVIDVYYRRIPACRSALTFATFVSFFPQLIAGPIPRARQLLPQYEVARRLTPELAARGAAVFLLGYAMKAFGASWLGPNVVDPVFASSAHFDRASHAFALFGYAAQVFFDFAGYSLLAIGTGRLLGLELPENFRHPFLSRSLPEFWQRWHITLNTWLFDYIYSPLATGRSWMRGRYEIAFVIVFLASGLWHGARWTFVLWGLLHGLGLVLHYRWDLFYKSLCRKDRTWVARRRSLPYTLVGWAVTQAFFLFSLLPFRAPSIGEAVSFLREMVEAPGPGSLRLHTVNDKIALLLIVSFFAAYHLAALGPGRRIMGAFFALPAPVRGVAYGAAVVLLALFVPVGVGTFIYANF
jgi:D-alanyl-lipoteichoic acid acyltransferase DltB (MBOAT superfamily)